MAAGISLFSLECFAFIGRAAAGANFIHSLKGPAKADALMSELDFGFFDIHGKIQLH